MIDKSNLATVEMMWRREVEAATTYKHLANREHNPMRRDILLRLAQALRERRAETGVVHEDDPTTRLGPQTFRRNRGERQRLFPRRQIEPIRDVCPFA